jgi:hypothetical protein
MSKLNHGMKRYLSTLIKILYFQSGTMPSLANPAIKSFRFS